MPSKIDDIPLRIIGEVLSNPDSYSADDIRSVLRFCNDTTSTQYVQLYAEVLSLFSRQEKILDVGAGLGFLEIIGEENGFNIHGLNPTDNKKYNALTAALEVPNMYSMSNVYDQESFTIETEEQYDIALLLRFNMRQYRDYLTDHKIKSTKSLDLLTITTRFFEALLDRAGRVVIIRSELTSAMWSLLMKNYRVEFVAGGVNLTPGVEDREDTDWADPETPNSQYAVVTRKPRIVKL